MSQNKTVPCEQKTEILFQFLWSQFFLFFFLFLVFFKVFVVNNILVSSYIYM